MATDSFVMKIAWNNNAEGWTFPVLPEKINIKRGGSNKDYRIVGTGPITTIEKPDLAEISFESFFPAQRYPFVTVDDLRKPNEYVNAISKWMNSGYPVRFVYVGLDNESKEAKIFLPMTITSFERYEQAGSPGDIFFSLKLKEYVFHKARKITNTVDKDGNPVFKVEPPERPDYRVPPTTWTIKKGETLMYVARMVYGDSGRWREIQKLNGMTDWDVRTMAIGKVLKLMPKK